MANPKIRVEWSEEERRPRAVSLATSLCRYAAGDRERNFMTALAVDLKLVCADVIERLDQENAA